MIFCSTDKLTIGKYSNIEVGLIYLLDPGYIEWMIKARIIGILDLDFLNSLWVINPFGTQIAGSVLAHHASADVEVFTIQYQEFVSFSEIKHSGHRYFKLSPYTKSQNLKTLEDQGFEPDQIIPQRPPDFNHFIHSPNSNFNTSTLALVPREIFQNSRGFASVRFSTNNIRASFYPLPGTKNLVVSSLLSPWLNISQDEILETTSSEKVYSGQIQNGKLLIKAPSYKPMIFPKV